VADSVEAALNNQQEDNVVTGVEATGGPSVDDIQRFASHLLSRNGVVTNGSGQITGGAFGTSETPQITHLTSGNVRLEGNVSGYGILITDGSLNIRGTVDFVGWIIARGAVTVSGNATILGSLWAQDVNFGGGGSMIINYCDTCLRQIADNAGGNSNNLPRPMAVCGWQEVLQ